MIEMWCRAIVIRRAETGGDSLADDWLFSWTCELLPQWEDDGILEIMGQTDRLPIAVAD